MKINEITSTVMNEEELILTTSDNIYSFKYIDIKRIEQKQNKILLNYDFELEFNDFNSATLFFYSLITIKKIK
jgi:hypothetical protein